MKAMNDIQKILLIVGVITFSFWLFLPSSVPSMKGYFTQHYYSPIYFFTDTSEWFDEWYQIAAFALSIGCFFGVYLFKNNK